MAAVEAGAAATRSPAPATRDARRAPAADASDEADAPAPATRRARQATAATPSPGRRPPAGDRASAEASFRRLLLGLCVCMAIVLVIALSAARTPA